MTISTSYCFNHLLRDQYSLEMLNLDVENMSISPDNESRKEIFKVVLGNLLVQQVV